MRWIAYYGCWLVITLAFKDEALHSGNVLWIAPALFTCAAMLYCVIKYRREEHETLYLQFLRDQMNDINTRN